MTEKEWMECGDPVPMLVYLHGKTGDRKLRLFSVACIRRGWHLIDDPDLRHAVEAFERFVDGCAKDKDRIAARKTGRRISDANKIQEVDGVVSGADHPQGCLGTELWWVANKTINLQVALYLGKFASTAIVSAAVKYRGPKFTRAQERDRKQQQSVLRDIFGNPFRPITLNPRCRTANIVSIAQGIYDERRFQEMPILADAIEDAGCNNRDILNHCRQPGVHVRGCWVVDLILRKK